MKQWAKSDCRFGFLVKNWSKKHVPDVSDVSDVSDVTDVTDVTSGRYERYGSYGSYMPYITVLEGPVALRAPLAYWQLSFAASGPFLGN